MTARSIRAGRAHVELGTKNKLGEGLAAAKAKLLGFGTAVVGVGAAAGGAIVGAAVAFAKFGDRLDKMSLRTGVSVEALSRLQFAAEQTGTDIDTLEKGFAGLSRTMFDAGRGSAEPVEALRQLGLTFDDLNGLNPDEQMIKIANAMNGVADASTRGAIAQRLFGRAGRQLLPLLQGGEQGMAALNARAEELGLTMSTEDAQAAAEFTDAMNEAWSTVKQAVVKIGGVIAPMLTNLSGWFAETMANIQNTVGEKFGGIVDAIRGGRIDLAGKIAFLKLEQAIIEVMASIAEVFGVSFDDLKKSLEEIIDKIAQAFGDLEVLRQRGANFFASMIEGAGKFIGVIEETPDWYHGPGGRTGVALENDAALSAAQERAENIKNSLSSAGKEFLDGLDRDKIAAELAAAEMEALKAREQADRERAERMSSGLGLGGLGGDDGFDTADKLAQLSLGTFNAAFASRVGASLAGSPEERTAKATETLVKESKKQTKALEEFKRIGLVVF